MVILGSLSPLTEVEIPYPIAVIYIYVFEPYHVSGSIFGVLPGYFVVYFSVDDSYIYFLQGSSFLVENIATI